MSLKGGETVSRIAELARDRLSPLVVGDRTFVAHGQQVVDLASLRYRVKVETQQFTTLSGLLDFLAVDGAKVVALKVVSPTFVTAIGALDDFGQRDTYAAAAVTPRDWLGRTMSQDDAVIVLSTEAEDTDGRRDLLAIIGNLVADEAIELLDDGISSKATAKKGVGSKGAIKVEPFHTLKLRQTFPEVEQPERTLLLRLGKQTGGGIGVTLHEAGGDGWKNDAMASIATYLRAGLKERELDIPVLA